MTHFLFFRSIDLFSAIELKEMEEMYQKKSKVTECLQVKPYYAFLSLYYTVVGLRFIIALSIDSSLKRLDL